MSGYQPTIDSLKQHPIPQWYSGAKFGIFIHWGIYSVPAWAPLTGQIDQVIANEGESAFFQRNPYAEWYLNSLRIENSPTHAHHLATYGPQFEYDAFAPQFNQAAASWNPEAWAEFFQQIQARYVVLTTKHHDGFLLWPSAHPNPAKPNYHAQRDLVGALSAAVKKRGMHMGLYYSGGLDWSFNPKPVQDQHDLYATIVQTPEFIAYVTAHWHELIDQYQPDILWNDIGYPANADVPALFAYYYNAIPNGVVNDRFGQSFGPRPHEADGVLTNPYGVHYDFITPEYTSFKNILATPWECCRGIGYSFGYNQIEDEKTYAAPEQLIHFLVDVVSKNGNLLLNIGPMADGTIPEAQRQCLLTIGAWLTQNGEAIFDTHPWIRAEAAANDGLPVRFTQKGDVVYAVLLGTPEAAKEIFIEGVSALNSHTEISLLNSESKLAYQQTDRGLKIVLESALPAAITHVFQMRQVTASPA